MYKLWITFFLLGSLLSTYNDNIYRYTFSYSSYILFTYIIFIIIFFIINKFYNKKILSILKLSTLISALFWGASHSAPSSYNPIKDVKIVKGSLGFGSLIVKDISTDTFYKTVGNYKGNLSGSIRCYQNKSHSLFNNHCLFINSERYEIFNDNVLVNISFKFKDFLYKNLSSKPYLSKFRPFISGIIYGDKSEISYFNKDIFKRLGIYHLLIISGLHFSLFAFFIREFIFFIIKIFYILKIISPLSWIKLSIILNIIICSLLMIFAYVVGLSSATQRALLIFIVHSISPYLIGTLPRSKLILLTITLQTILFPLGFISIATFMSWTSYLLFIDLASTLSINKYSSSRNKDFYPYFYYNHFFSYIFYLLSKLKTNLRLYIFKIYHLLYVQIKLMFLTYLCFSQLSLISCFTNIILVPIFPIILFISLYFSLFPPNILDSYLYNIFVFFFNIIDKFLDLEKIIFHYIDIHKISTLKSFNVISLILSTIWIWNLYKKIFTSNSPKYLSLDPLDSYSNEE